MDGIGHHFLWDCQYRRRSYGFNELLEGHGLFRGESLQLGRLLVSMERLQGSGDI